MARFLLKQLVPSHKSSVPEGKAADTLDMYLKDSSLDVVLPRSFVEGALGKMWNDLLEKDEVAAKIFAKMLVEKYAPDKWGSPENVLTAGIPEVVGKVTPSQESWAKENSSRVYNSEQGKWVDAGKQPAEAKPEPAKESEPEELMGRRGELNDRIDMLKTAVDGSPTGVAIVGVSRASEGPNKMGFDHILVVYKDHQSGEIRVAEMMPGDPRLPGTIGSVLNSKNNPMSLREAVRTWDNYTAVPLVLTPEQDARFRSSLAKNLSQENTYSFITQTGNHCASAVRKALVDAGVWDGQEKGFLAYLEKLGINVLIPGTLIKWAMDRGGVYYDSDRFRTSMHDTMDGRDEGTSDSQPLPPKSDVTAGSDEEGASPLDGPWHIMSSANAADRAGLPTEIRASLPPALDADQDASQKLVALASDTEDAGADDASQHLETDEGDDEEALEEEVTLASDPDDARTHDDAAMTETAKADVEVDPASGDQAGAQVATSAPIVPDEGFTFSMFAKPGVPLEVAKQALPAEQASPAEENSGAGIRPAKALIPTLKPRTWAMPRRTRSMWCITAISRPDQDAGRNMRVHQALETVTLLGPVGRACALA